MLVTLSVRANSSNTRRRDAWLFVVSLWTVGCPAGIRPTTLST